MLPLLISSNTSRTKEPERRFKDCMKKPVDAKQEFLFFSLSDFGFTPKENGIERKSNCAASIDLFFHCVSLDKVHVINLSLNCINNVSHMDNTTEH